MKRILTVAVTGLLVGALATAGGVQANAQGSAARADGTLAVRVVRDVTGTGVYQPALALGVAGAPVTVTDAAGKTATATTAADGTASVALSGLTGGKYRVDGAPPAGSKLQAAPAGPSLAPLTSFVDLSDGKNVSLTMGLWNPADYCQDNPTIVTACQRSSDTAQVPANAGARSLATFPYTARGTSPAQTQIASQKDAGTLYGIAYRKQDKRIFSGAYAKRLAAFGPGNQGAIYVTPAGGGATTVFATVPAAGSTAHKMNTNGDGGYFLIPGTEGLGDVEISEDGSELYAVNMADRKLYVFDATKATAAAPKSSIAIPDPGCAAAGDWRPMGLGFRDGMLYVGGVCSGASNQNASGLKAVVQTYNPATAAFTGTALNQSLGFQRGFAVTTESTITKWQPWLTSMPAKLRQAGETSYPQPMLSDIAFEANGDLVLGFRDRWGDQGGYASDAPDGSAPASNVFDTGGDLNRACRQADGTFVLDGNGGCKNNVTAANSGQENPSTVKEFYPGEWYYDQDSQAVFHQETAQGAIALPLQQQRMVTTGFDITASNFSSGVAFFDRTNGTASDGSAYPNGYRIELGPGSSTAGTVTEGWGKANGLGDLEVLCDMAPVQIGNRTWFDTDRDGIQDPDEPAVAGVVVQLLACDGTGAPLATATTDANGLYYFGKAQGVAPNTCYTLKFDYSKVDTTKLPGAPPVARLKWTTPNAGDNPQINSKPDAGGVAKVTTGDPGTVDHTQDAGIITAPLNKLGDYVWVDANKNGIQDAGETPVAGVSVVVQNAQGTVVGAAKTTDAQGKYLFDDLPDGTYKVCFDIKNLPAAYADYLVTKQNAAQHNGTDSAADPATGCTATTDLGAAKREDLTLDLGIVAPVNRVGDLVWLDKDRNGIQDAGEPGVPGVVATLQDGTGKPVGSPVTTDAQGKYLFDNLPDGTYKVCFDLSKLPAEYAGATWTKLNAAQHNGTDSTVDPATACTAPTELKTGHREDLTLDGGIVTPLNKLGDYVWVDANKNGIQDSGETPVPGVKATLQDGAGKTIATTTTGADGKYLFSDLPDGVYQVCFDIKNMPAAYADYQVTKKAAAGLDGTDSAADPATGCTASTNLGPAKRADLTLDMGIIAPVNRVGDYVWVDGNKNGIQDQDEPGVPGVVATLQDGTGKPVGSPVTTGDDGKYLFTDLPDGTYKVCFDLSKLPPQYAGATWTKQNAASHNGTDSTVDPATGCTPTTDLKVGHREDLTLDGGIVTPLNKVGDLLWADTNKNGIQDAGEPGVPDVTVTLQDKDGTPVGSTVKTDAQGKYLFDNLLDGTYKVCFDVKNLPAQYADYVVTKQNAAGHNGTDSYADATGCTPTTTVGPGKREDLTLDAGIIAPPNRLGDYVWVDENRNGVQDTGEPGVPDVPVTLQDGTGKPIGDPVKTGADGKYIFENLPDGTYKVCFDISKLPPQYAGATWTKQNAAQHNGTDSTVDPATACTAVTELKLGHREDLTLDGGIVTPLNKLGDYVWVDANKNGIQDAGEAPVPGVKATLQDGTGKPIGNPVTTDAQGKYLFADLPDGTYQVCFDIKALPAQYADYLVTKQNTAQHNGTDSAADPATGCTVPTVLGPGKREDLTLDMGIVEPVGRVGDLVWVDKNRDGIQDPGEPGVPGVIATLQDGTGKPIGDPVTTDAQGKYLFDNLPNGTYKVCFDLSKMPAEYAGSTWTKPNAASHDGTDSTVDPATACTVTTELKTGHRQDLTLDGGIVTPLNKLGDYVWVDANKNGIQDAGETPVPGVKATLQDKDGNPIGAPATTDAAGKYLFADLPDGTYKVCFDLKTLPAAYADYVVTKPNAAGHNGTDSYADPENGCTPTTDLGPGKREDLTLDMGIVPPVNRVGDLVWVDKNRDGIQDPGEPGVPGVVATLQDGTGKPVGEPVTTGPDGKYLFTDLPDGTYKVCFDLSKMPAEYAGSTWTKQNAASHNGKDSTVDPATGCTPVTELKTGHREDLTLDGGIVTPLNKLGDYVWVDANRDGLQDAGEVPVPGVKVTLQDEAGKPIGAPATTDAAGKYLFGDLPDGTYKVCFDVKNLPAAYADYQVTKQNAAGHNGTDSAADLATGCTMTTVLGPNKREDLTLDLGIAPPVNRVGDFVWADRNGNGIQDAGEPGVPGMTVVLQDGSGKPVGEPVKTGPDGKYLFTDLPDGTYKVCFDVKNMPADYADYVLTKQNAAGHDGTDSAADPVTACTPATVLGTGHREDLTLDAGIVAPPNQIGDFVWYDKDKSGLQDDGEPGVPDVPVTLVDKDGKTVDSVKTDPAGKYLFENVPDGTYKVCFDLSKLDAPYTEYVPTKPGAGGHNGKDSAADPATKCTEPVTVGVGHRSELKEDLGIVPPVNRLGDYVWHDTNGNGLQDPGEQPIGDLTVTLKDDKGAVLATTKTGPDGKYLFTDLPDGTYQVCFPVKDLPGEYAGYALTKVDAAGHNGKDSAADPASGCTRPTELGAGHREDFTLDAGYAGGHEAPAPAKPGGLSYTGVAVGGLITLALLLLGGGGVLILVSRRRRLKSPEQRS